MDDGSRESVLTLLQPQQTSYTAHNLHSHASYLFQLDALNNKGLGSQSRPKVQVDLIPRECSPKLQVDLIECESGHNVQVDLIEGESGPKVQVDLIEGESGPKVQVDLFPAEWQKDYDLYRPGV